MHFNQLLGIRIVSASILRTSLVSLNHPDSVPQKKGMNHLITLFLYLDFRLLFFFFVHSASWPKKSLVVTAIFKHPNTMLISKCLVQLFTYDNEGERHLPVLVMIFIMSEQA